MEISKGANWLLRGGLLVVVIALGSNYAIQFFLRYAPTGTAKTHPTHQEKPANEAAFRAALDAGNQAIRDGRYTDALDRFLEAERSAQLLSIEQYDALKTARLQLATTYEAGGDRSAMDIVYRALVGCAVAQSQAALYPGKNNQRALDLANDAEQLADHLSDGAEQVRRGAFQAQVSALLGLKQYSEAVEIQQRYIDSLKDATRDGGPELIQAYASLSYIHSQAQDWNRFRDALVLMIEECNRAGEGHRIIRSWAEYNLVIGYYRAGDTETALSKADEFYSKYAAEVQGATPVMNVAYQPNQFASLALQIATEAKMPEAMDSWKKKGGTTAGSISVIALHPYQEH